jgi:hypothetical protein
MMKIITNTISILYCYWWCSEDDFTFGSLQAHFLVAVELVKQQLTQW